MLTKSVPATPPDRVSLKQRVLNAGAWSLAGYGFSQVLRFGSNLIMTRLLVPEMFGVMAIATMVMIALAMFSDLGLKQNVVQSKRGHDPTFLNTAWAIQILRGMALWLGALCVALLLYLANRAGLVPKDTVYTNPSLPWVVAVLSTTGVIGGFQSTKTYEASRNLALRHITKIEIIAQVTGLFCMIVWASVDRSIWALVAGGVCSSLTSVTLTHLWLPGTTNRWQWDRPAALEIFHFGKWIFAASVFGFLVNNGDRLLLAGMVDAQDLGIYVVAFMIFGSVEQLLTRIAGEISLPALSEVARERPGELKHYYYRFRVAIGAFSNTCSGLLIAFGQTLVSLLYDYRYWGAGWILQLLAACLLAVPFRVAIQCFIALGDTRTVSRLAAVRAAALFVCMSVGFHFAGMAGAVIGVVASYMSIIPSIVMCKLRNGLFDLRIELAMLPLVFVGLGFGGLLNALMAGS